MSLNEYNSKRNFSVTNEPVGKVNKVNKKRIFTVQHHYSRREHYDFRLLYNKELVSFAIPKGPSYDTKDKRLSVRVENHPVSYANFEGVIPKGEYGAGTVMLWDRGYYVYDKSSDFEKGPIKFTLFGERLFGKWTLVRIKDDNWLMIKDKDEFAGNRSINKFKTSVLSGKTKKEIESDNYLGISLTHGDKVIFKKGKVTKKDIFDYYSKVYKRMKKFFDNRLISTVRCPSGNMNDKFFMKHLDNSRLGLKRIKDAYKVTSKYYFVKNLEGLLSEVQMNSYEFHMWGCKVNDINKPDILVFDFDPDVGLSLKKVRDGVKDLKRILDGLGLKSYVKTSGGKGYHVLVPLKTNSWRKTEKIAFDVASLMEGKYPYRYTTNIRKNKREKKIFIDYLRNKKGSTCVMPYSVRLNEKASISCPIKWSEIDTIKPSGITIFNIEERLRLKDPWESFFD